MVSINWGRLSAQIVKKMESGIILSPRERRELVRVIADEILIYSTNPSKKLVRIVAQDCVSRYAILEDKMDNTKLGNGYESLAYQIYTRVENLRRKSNISNEKSPADEPKETKKRNTIIDSYGCVQWDPPFPINETNESLDSKKKFLKEKKNDEMIKLLTDTYFLQRQDINNGLKMENLVKEWPFLFVDIGMLYHFKLLTNIDIMNTLENSMIVKGKEIIYFLSSCRKKNFIFNHEINEDISELLWILLGVTKYFEEQESFFITLSPVNMHFISLYAYLFYFHYIPSDLFLFCFFKDFNIQKKDIPLSHPVLIGSGEFIYFQTR